MISLGSLYQFLRADWASLEQIWPVLKSRFDQFGQLVSKREDVSFPFLDERRFFWQKYWAWTLIFTLLPLHWEPSYSVVLVVLEVVSESLVEVSGKGTILLVNVGPLQSFIVVSSCVTLFHWWVGTSCAS